MESTPPDARLLPRARAGPLLAAAAATCSVAAWAWRAAGVSPGQGLGPSALRRLLQAAPPAGSPPGYDEYCWMWGDAGTTLFGHGTAEYDLLRWSEWKNCAATIRDLEAFRASDGKRPVEMMGLNTHGKPVQERKQEIRPTLGDLKSRHKLRFGSIDEAVRYLYQHRSEYSWMWGDAGINFLGHGLAEKDPLRWSPWERLSTIIEDLEAYRTEENAHRPLEIQKDGQGKVTFANVAQALRYLRGQEDLHAPAAAHSPGQTVARSAPAPPPAARAQSGAPAAESPHDAEPAARYFSDSGGGRAAEPIPPQSSVPLVLAGLVALVLSFCGCLGCCFLQGKFGVQGEDVDEEADTSPLKAGGNSAAPAQGPAAPAAAGAARRQREEPLDR